MDQIVTFPVSELPERGATEPTEVLTALAPYLTHEEQQSPSPNMSAQDADSTHPVQSTPGSSDAEDLTASDVRAAPLSFAWMPWSDHIRDAMGLVLLGCAIVHPWNGSYLTYQQAGALSAVIIAMCTLGLPYLARVGALPESWTVHTTRALRLIGVAPLAVMAMVQIFADLFAGTGLGTGIGLSLAGAVCVAQPRSCEFGPPESEEVSRRRWRLSALAVAVLMVFMAVISMMIALFDVGSGLVSVVAVLRLLVGVVVVVLIIFWPMIAVMRGIKAAQYSLIALGIAATATMVITQGGVASMSRQAFYDISSSGAIGGQQFITVDVSETAGPFTGLFLGSFLLMPMLAALLISVPVSSLMGPPASIHTWLGTGARLFEIIAALSALTLVASVELLLDGTDTLRGVAMVLAAGLATAVAVIGRLMAASLRGRSLGIGLGMVLLIAGAITLGAGSGVSERMIDISLPLVGMVFLPLLLISAYTVPAVVRERYRPAESSFRWAPKVARIPTGSAEGVASVSRVVPQQFPPPQSGPQVPETEQMTGFTAEEALNPATPLAVLAQIVQDAPHLRAQVAANPSTYPALLEWLAALGDPAVDEALRSRP